MAAAMATASKLVLLSTFGFLLLLLSLEECAEAGRVVAHHFDEGSSKNPSTSGSRHPFSEKQQSQILSAGDSQIRTGGNPNKTDGLSPVDYDEFLNRLTATERSKEFMMATKNQYSVWRREYGKDGEDRLLIWMKDQVILARVLSRVAHANKNDYIKKNLSKLVKDSLVCIGEANSDTELKSGALEQALKMDRALAEAKVKIYDCEVVARKLRAMIKTMEETVIALKRKSMFLMQVTSWTTSKPLHCLQLQLTTDYYVNDHDYFHTDSSDMSKTEDPHLYHYAIFSDNILATSVVVESAIAHAKDPDKHVFHIVTDGLNFAAMKMWFIAHPHVATVEVKSIDDFSWIDSSYSPVIRQFGLNRLDEFYTEKGRPTHYIRSGDGLRFTNPKYLSVLNHIRFYIPEMFPNLDKILFLDDDVVVQGDLTHLWQFDMQGLVNGAVEICKRNHNVFGSYLDFSNLKISQSFDPHACAWAFGMNIFDLKQWRLHNLTEVYHHWQNLNEDGQLWQLGTLPPGLVTFYNLTYPIHKRWHLPGLGYQPSISTTEIETARVIHYSGNNKPWTDLAISKYKGYWTKYVDFEDEYIRNCNFSP